MSTYVTEYEGKIVIVINVRVGKTYHGRFNRFLCLGLGLFVCVS